MSAVADVSEMQGICAEIARRLCPDGQQKQQIPLLAKKLGVTENRALEFIRAKARRIDSFEKDRARALRDELKRARERQRDAEHLEWLRQQIEGAAGTDLSGPHVDALKRLFRMDGEDAGAVEVPAFDAADEDQSVGWGQ